MHTHSAHGTPYAFFFLALAGGGGVKPAGHGYFTATPSPTWRPGFTYTTGCCGNAAWWSRGSSGASPLTSTARSGACTPPKRRTVIAGGEAPPLDRPASASVQ